MWSIILIWLTSPEQRSTENIILERDTLTMTGVTNITYETDAKLGKKVADSLSLSGETVKPDNFSVIHRNGNQTRKTRQGKDIPPSITVWFSKIGTWDKVLRGYKIMT